MLLCCACISTEWSCVNCYACILIESSVNDPVLCLYPHWMILYCVCYLVSPLNVRMILCYACILTEWSCVVLESLLNDPVLCLYPHWMILCCACIPTEWSELYKFIYIIPMSHWMIRVVLVSPLNDPGLCLYPHWMILCCDCIPHWMTLCCACVPRCGWIQGGLAQSAAHPFSLLTPQLGKLLDASASWPPFWIHWTSHPCLVSTIQPALPPTLWQLEQVVVGCKEGLKQRGSHQVQTLTQTLTHSVGWHWGQEQDWSRRWRRLITARVVLQGGSRAGPRSLPAPRSLWGLPRQWLRYRQQCLTPPDLSHCRLRLRQQQARATRCPVWLTPCPPCPWSTWAPPCPSPSSPTHSR